MDINIREQVIEAFTDYHTSLFRNDSDSAKTLLQIKAMSDDELIAELLATFIFEYTEHDKQY